MAVYFRILHKKIETSVDYKKDAGKMEPSFRRFKLNSGILKLTDVIVTRLLEYTVVDDGIETVNTRHNFFSQRAWSYTMLRVADKKIRQEEDEITALRKLATACFRFKVVVRPSKNLAGGLHWSDCLPSLVQTGHI